MINKQLAEFYNSKINGIDSLSELEDDIDGPLLMHCWEEHYAQSKFKILFIGQENHGWIGDVSDDVDDLMNGYKEFEFSKNGSYTTFWQYVYWINKLLNPNSTEGKNFLWTNVSKFCTCEGKPLEWSTHLNCVKHFNCLLSEIEIVKPDVIFFLSGPNYDHKINAQFESNLVFKQVFEDIPARQVAIIEHPKLPKHTYRTYHPNYLQRSRNDAHITKVVELIMQSK